MIGTVPIPQTDFSITAETLWSDAYVLAARTLREVPGFEEWLRRITRTAKVDELKDYWRHRGWAEEHHAVKLGEAYSTEPARTVGLMLAVNLPYYGTLRFAFPAKLVDVRKYRTVLRNKMPAGWFPDVQCIRHQHAQINGSFIFGERQGKSRGLAYYCLASGKPVYCAEMSTYANRRFAESVNKDEESGVGMASILYLPCTTEGSASAYTTLALYSPLPNAFQGLNWRTPPHWLHDFTKRSQLKAVVDLLCGLDDSYRSGLLTYASKVGSLLTRWREDIENVSNHLEGRLTQASSSVTVNDLNDKLLTLKRDPHYSTLFWTQDLLQVHSRPRIAIRHRDIQSLSDYLFTVNETLQNRSRKKHVVFEEFWQQSQRVEIAPRITPHIEDSIGNNLALNTVAAILNAFIRNAGRHSQGLIVVNFKKLGRRIQIEVKSEASYDRETVARYWLVRQGHSVPSEASSANTYRSSGLNLYMIRLMAVAHGLDFVIDLPFQLKHIQLGDPIGWICRLTVHMKEYNNDRQSGFK